MKQFFAKKRNIIIIFTVAIIGIIVFFAFRGNNSSNGILTDTVKKQDLKRTVLATGQVVSSTDLALSFQSSGVVKSVNVKVGDKVASGQVLATLDQKNQLASLEQARGARDSAQANYDKVVSGATSEDVQVSRAAVTAAQATLDNAKATYDSVVAQQKILVENARLAWINSGLSADRLAYYDTSATLTVSGTYTGMEQGEYDISLYSDGGSGFFFKVSGLENSTGVLKKGTPLGLGTRGLSMTFSTTGTFSGVDSWRIAIPNTRGSSYVTDFNAYQAALQTQNAAIVTAGNTVNSAQAALDQAKATLVLKQAEARPEDIASAAAAVTSASGQVAAAAAALENTMIRAPASGTMTAVDIKVGELASSLKEVMVLQDVSSLHVEANVSEASVASIKPGQSTEVTFDALGPDQKYAIKVLLVDPASIVISGVVNYKVTFSLENLVDVKPGMTANLVVLTAERTGVLSVPQRAIILRDGNKLARVITDPKTKAYQERQISTGLEGDGGLVEVIEGLAEGDAIVTFINSK